MKLMCAFLLAASAALGSFGQHGGKAEPRRIEFEKGRSSVLLIGTLKNRQEMEYVFAAAKGQRVTVTNPATTLFDFRIFSEEFDMETEFDSSRSFTFEMPQTGDYQFFVRKKLTASPRAARFRITLEIR